ncbi:6-phosphogluconate dehydrogenase [Aurantibacter crassamenti]|uniref:6-phosphogluconate dehydrogenase n=1 Tax=Aurantibacter crassamenti TaxID=1837375 RepID=UPI00193A5CF4|nr:6-phosphogluconate dehydrogenase [Aurantibacter crassamenti]MBM1107584.1 6-phosphogluconate dehydrogenase [Aurantibacter crassamenti]
MKKALVLGLTFLLIAIAAFYAFIYFVPYSQGYRSGELIKFSSRGVLTKTWEGEISQGISGAQIFSFSVLDKEKEVIQKLKDYQGKYVKVTYVERYATFFWLGDSNYFITEVVEEKSPHFNK